MKAFGFSRFGTHNYPELNDKGYYWVVMDRNYPVRSKISVLKFLMPGFKRKDKEIFNSDPIGAAKTKKLFENIWFDTPEEAWEMADWFMNNFVYTPEIQALHKEYRKTRKDTILKEIRRIRKNDKQVLQYMIDRWQFKEDFTL